MKKLALTLTLLAWLAGQADSAEPHPSWVEYQKNCAGLEKPKTSNTCKAPFEPITQCMKKYHQPQRQELIRSAIARYGNFDAPGAYSWTISCRHPDYPSANYDLLLSKDLNSAYSSTMVKLQGLMIDAQDPRKGQ